MVSKNEKYLKQQQTILEDMKKVAKGAGKSIAQLAPWTLFEEAEPLPQLPDDRIFVNSRYQVNIRTGDAPPPFGMFIQLSIKTRDKAAFHDWRDFQRIKNELVGPEFEAMELYPAEERLVDTANQYYVFVFPRLKFPKRQFPFGFRERLVSELCLPGVNSISNQRPFEAKPADLETEESFKRRLDKVFNRNQEQVIPAQTSEEPVPE